MPNLIAYIDLIARRVLLEEEDLDDELDAAWKLLTEAEREVANHVAKRMSGHMGDER